MPIMYQNVCAKVTNGGNNIDLDSAFTLPDTEADTETDKLTKNPVGICVNVRLCAV